MINSEKAMQILHEMIEAHGGIERWSGLEALDAPIRPLDPPPDTSV